MHNRKPVFLLAGGRRSGSKSPDPVLQTVIGEIGKTSPTVAYVGAANEDDKRFFQFMQTSFIAAGAGKVEHAVIYPKKADLNSAREILQSADAVFISGGDVELGIKTLEEKNMLDFLCGMGEQGKFFFGLSAGSIMLAKKWVRWPDPDDDSTAELFTCLGLAPVICDTHAEDDGWEELKAALKLEQEDSEGYGIASGTAIKVDPDGKVSALGGPVIHFAHRQDSLVRLPDIKPALKKV
jgi:cyanophycinase-like exopeptidase